MYNETDKKVKAMLDFSMLSKVEQEKNKHTYQQILRYLNEVCKIRQCDIHTLVLDYRIKRYSELTRGIYKKALSKEELAEYSELNDELRTLDTCSRCYFEVIDKIRILKNKNVVNKICNFNNKPLFNIESVNCSHFKIKLT